MTEATLKKDISFSGKVHRAGKRVKVQVVTRSIIWVRTRAGDAVPVGRDEVVLDGEISSGSPGLAPFHSTRFKPYRVKSHDKAGKFQTLYRFPNGFGASVVCDRSTLRPDRYEVALVRWQGSERFSVTEERGIAIQDWRSSEQVEKILEEIQTL